MNSEARERGLENIRENITRFGYHLYVVSGRQDPRWVYSIGLSPKLAYELIFAGGILIMYKEVGKIVEMIVERLVANR
jgi:hypothetical protein